MLKVLHIAPCFYPATYWGGPVYSLYSLCNVLAKKQGVELRVLTTDTAGPGRTERLAIDSFPAFFDGGYRVYFCRKLFGRDFSPSLLLRLWRMIEWADIVHLTAVYSVPTIPALGICRLLRKPVVWSPRGALQRWEGTTKPRIKKMWDYLCAALISKKSGILHVTSKREATESQSRIPGADSVLIPNGVDVPEAIRPRSWLPEGTLRLLYLGRLDPKKGIDNLLRALGILKDEAISLTVCGIGDRSYSLALRRLADQLALRERVRFRGRVDVVEKSAAFMDTDVCVVPSFTENFGLVVAEALAHGVPVIASRGTPWDELEKKGCGLWVTNDPDSLAEAIMQIRDRNLPEMGARGREWMRETFGWDSVGREMLQLYERLRARTRGER